MKPALDVARRELTDNLATWKLPLLFVLTSLLLVTGVASLSMSFTSDVQAHALVQDEYTAQNRDHDAAALAHRFLAAPNALSLLVGGPGEDARSALARPPSVSNASIEPPGDPMRSRFAAVDLGTIGVGVLSLVAILLSYDAVAGEKERGTLKLLLVNPLSRTHVLLGKYGGAMASLLAPLGAALLLALVAVTVSGVRFQPSDYGRLVLILVFLVLLVSFFVLAGIAVSAMTHRSAVAILALAILWLVLVSGAGSIATFTANVDPQGRGIDEVAAELSILHDDYDQRERELTLELARLRAKNETQNGAMSPQERARLAALPAELLRLRAERAEDQEALLDAYYRGLDSDLRRAEGFASLSPAESFRSLSQRLARTDHAALRDQLDEFSTYLREVSRLRAERAAAGDTDAPTPAFRHQPVSVANDLARAQPFLIALLVQNIVAFAGARYAFARYDVR